MHKKFPHERLIKQALLIEMATDSFAAACQVAALAIRSLGDTMARVNPATLEKLKGEVECQTKED